MGSAVFTQFPVHKMLRRLMTLPLIDKDNIPILFTKLKEKYAAQIKELKEIVFYDKEPQTGSIFMEDPSFAFDYAHILPLVEKCSILHGHTSAVMVELVGQMKNNLLVDFGDAKRIIKIYNGKFTSRNCKFF